MEVPSDPVSIMDETHADDPEAYAAEDAAMTSLKWPPSLRPMAPIVIYMILSAAGPMMIFTMLPQMRKSYFGGSDAKAALWTSVFDAANAAVGLFTSGLVGLAADAYGRRIIMLVSAFQSFAVMFILWYFGEANPWPYIAVGNTASLLGSSRIGNAAVCSMVIADVFDKDCRLLPMIIFMVTIFLGVVPAVVPSVLGLSAQTTATVSMSITLFVLVYVWLFWEETLPVESRKRIKASELQNPLIPLKFVLKQPFLATFAALAITFLFPFYLSAGISVYYLDDKLGYFSPAENGALGASVAVATVICIVALLPILTRFFRPENIVLMGMISITLNSVLYCCISESWQMYVFFPPTEAFAFATMTLMSQMVSVVVPQNEQGVVNGTFVAFKELAIITGPICGALLYSVGKEHLGSFEFIELPYILNIAVGVCGIGVCVFALKPEIKRRRMITRQPIDEEELPESPVSPDVVEELSDDATKLTS